MTVFHKPIKTVLFDFDDTLVDTKTVKVKSLMLTAKKFYNQDISEELFLSHWGKPLKEYMITVFGPFDSNIDRIMRNYTSLREVYPTISFPETAAVISSLKDLLPIGIVTSGSKDFVAKDLHAIGINIENFFYIQGAEDTDTHKPDPEVFTPVLSLLSKKSIAPNEILYVGDALSDFLAADKAGMNFLGIARDLKTTNAFRSQKARVISSLDEILTHLTE